MDLTALELLDNIATEFVCPLHNLTFNQLSKESNYHLYLLRVFCLCETFKNNKRVRLRGNHNIKRSTLYHTFVLPDISAFFFLKLVRLCLDASMSSFKNRSPKRQWFCPCYIQFVFRSMHQKKLEVLKCFFNRAPYNIKKNQACLHYRCNGEAYCLVYKIINVFRATDVFLKMLPSSQRTQLPAIPINYRNCGYNCELCGRSRKGITCREAFYRFAASEFYKPGGYFVLNVLSKRTKSEKVRSLSFEDSSDHELFSQFRNRLLYRKHQLGPRESFARFVEHEFELNSFQIEPSEL